MRMSDWSSDVFSSDLAMTVADHPADPMHGWIGGDGGRHRCGGNDGGRAQGRSGCARSQPDKQGGEYQRAERDKQKSSSIHGVQLIGFARKICLEIGRAHV